MSEIELAIQDAILAIKEGKSIDSIRNNEHCQCLSASLDEVWTIAHYIVFDYCKNCIYKNIRKE